jgi:RNA polymerase sigma factor (sigma-70 family)
MSDVVITSYPVSLPQLLHQQALIGAPAPTRVKIFPNGRQALVSEESRHLLRGIRALPPRQREALILRYFLDLSEEETAQSMDVRRGTVKSATSRALAALGQRMQEY